MVCRTKARDGGPSRSVPDRNRSNAIEWDETRDKEEIDLPPWYNEKIMGDREGTEK